MKRKSIVSLIILCCMFYMCRLTVFGDTVSQNGVESVNILDEKSIPSNDTNSIKAVEEIDGKLGWYSALIYPYNTEVLVDFRKEGWYAYNTQGINHLYTINSVHYKIDGSNVIFYQKDKERASYTVTKTGDDKVVETVYDYTMYERNDVVSLDFSELSEGKYYVISTNYPRINETYTDYPTTSIVYVVKYKGELYLCDSIEYDDDYLNTDFVEMWETHQEFKKMTEALNLEDVSKPYEHIISAGDTNKEWIEIANQVCAGLTSDEEKVLALHDWVCDNIYYGRMSVNSPTLYETRHGVCQDYAELFDVLVRSQGIPCIMVHVGSIAHASSAVYIDGIWHFIDVTWDCQNTWSSDEGYVRGERDYLNYALGVLAYWGNRKQLFNFFDTSEYMVYHNHFSCCVNEESQNDGTYKYKVDVSKMILIKKGEYIPYADIKYDESRNKTVVTCLYDGRTAEMDGNLWTDYDDNIQLPAPTIIEWTVDKKFGLMSDGTIFIAEQNLIWQNPEDMGITWNDKERLYLLQGYPVPDIYKSNKSDVNSGGTTSVQNVDESKTPKVVLTEKTNKEDQSIKPVRSKYSYKYKTLKKKAKKFRIKSVYNNGTAHGSVSYTVSKYPKGGKKYIKVDKRGNVTIKKKAKKGTYKITISLAGTTLLNPASTTITIKVK